MYSEQIYRIALTLIPGVGPVKARSLLAFCGSAEGVFSEKKQKLLRIPEIGDTTAQAISACAVLEEAAAEAEYIDKHQIQTAFFTEAHYPQRLRHCDDAPVMIYYRGHLHGDAPRVVSIVGTRMASAYGRQFCEKFIEELAPFQPVVVSGLAFGIDILAHKAALKNGLPTIACLAHGLSTIYPREHTAVARDMELRGAVLSEFISTVKPDPPLFPSRNRIIAGMADCTVVIESGIKGGSLITAFIAGSYSREVFAVPGRVTDATSAGCNELIRRNAAAIITSAHELAQYMNWSLEGAPRAVQTSLFQELTPEQQEVMTELRATGRAAIDVLSLKLKKPVSALSAVLLDMEFSGLVKSLPGKMYEPA